MAEAKNPGFFAFDRGAVFGAQVSGEERGKGAPGVEGGQGAGVDADLGGVEGFI